MTDPLAALEALAGRWQDVGDAEGATADDDRTITLWVNAGNQLRAAIAEARAQMGEASGGDMEAVAKWLANSGYPIDYSTTEPPPLALRQALVNFIHRDDDGKWHGNTLDRDETADWLAGEAGWPNWEHVE